MSAVTIEITGTGRLWVDRGTDGRTVAYSLPAGCVLRRAVDGGQWQDVAQASPFTHTGAPATYAVDCDTFTGPATATLEIV